MSMAVCTWGKFQIKGLCMLGSDIIADTFIRHGLKRIYTFPGGTLAPTFDAIYRRNIDIFCARHEQGAGYAGLAVARLTRTPQVVMVTSGPGVTNLVTVVADAYFDSTPLIALTGQVGTGDINSGRLVRQCGFQQVDAVSLMKSIVKATFLPLSPADLPSMLEEGFAVAMEGRPGPVLVDLPMDVQRGALDGRPVTKARKPMAPTGPEPRLIAEAAEWLAKAQRPVIFAGQGVLLSDACTVLRGLAESRGIPVAMSLLGIGSFSTNSSLSLGFPGHTGNQCAGRAIHEADVLLVVGARLDVRQTGTCTDQFVPNGRVIRIDLDAAELTYPRVRSDLVIHADARLALAELVKVLEGHRVPDLSKWRAQIEEWKAQYPLAYDSQGTLVRPQQVIETVNHLTHGKRVVAVSGVGSHQQWTARHFDFDFPDRAWLTSGGHGAMGYDLPTAIGAQLARPDDLVVCFVGDGSLQINIQELQTAVVYGTAVKIFVLDNHRLAMVSQFQLLNWNSDPTTGNKVNPDFAAVARAYGMQAYTINKPEDVNPVAKKALAHDGPALVHCLVDPSEDVMPMLLPGQTMDRMWPYA
jgi:acetolactate synthase-1/2/3 large subunit